MFAICDLVRLGHDSQILKVESLLSESLLSLRRLLNIVRCAGFKCLSVKRLGIGLPSSSM